MDSSCPDCGTDTLVTDFVAGSLVLVCSACGYGTNPTPGSNENESTPCSSSHQNEDDSDVDIPSELESDESAEDDAEDIVHSNTILKTPPRPHLVEIEVSTVNSKSNVAGSASTATSTSSSTTTSSSSSSVLTCKSCGGQNLIRDTIHETEQWVCADCGYFAEVQELVSSHEYTAIPGRGDTAYQWTRAPKPKFANDGPYITKGKASGINTVQDISSRLSLRPDLTDQAVSLYEKLYLHESIKFTSISLKDTLGVCCVYTIARENGVKVTLKTLFSLFPVKRKWFTRALRLIKSIRSKPLFHQTVSSLHEHILSGGKFSLGLLGKIKKLVDVCEKGFVTQGRDHTNVVVGAAYLVWVSEDIPARKRLTLRKFCSQHHLPYTRHCQTMKNEVEELLATLASQLPWRNAPVEKDNVVYYLDNVIKFSETLIGHASQNDQEFAVPTEAQDSGTSQSQLSPSDHPKGGHTLPALAPPSMRRRRYSAGSSIDPSQLHLPPNVSRADLDSEVLLETEFDQEISSYLLSPEEVRLKKEMLKF